MCMSKIKPTAIRYCGEIEIHFTYVEYDNGRFSFTGKVVIPGKPDWNFSELKPAYQGICGTDPKLLDHAAADALGFYGYEDDDKWSKDHNPDDIYNYGETRDYGQVNLFQISRFKNGPIVLERG